MTGSQWSSCVEYTSAPSVGQTDDELMMKDDLRYVPPPTHNVTRLTTYCQEHAPTLANVVSTTSVQPPGTLCHLTYI